MNRKVTIMADINLTISVITLNTNGLNASTIRLQLLKWGSKNQ
jgi:hypothetical protein